MENNILRVGKTDDVNEGNLVPKYVVNACVLLTLLIFGRAVSDIFYYAVAAASICIFFLAKTQDCVPILFFLLPFSAILKLRPNDISVFTILFFLVVVKIALLEQKIGSKVLICTALFLMYSLVFSGLDQWKTTVTICMGIVFLFYLSRSRFSATASVFSYSAGLIFSSLLGVLKKYLPIINDFVSDNRLLVGDGEYAYRFSGLQGNANYYSLDIAIALAAIIVLMHVGGTRKSLTTCFVILSIFGFMSVSKSFLITWLFLIICWMGVSFKRSGKISNFIFVAIVCLIGIYALASEYINLYVIRLLSDRKGSLSDITSGRVDIWLTYIREILGDLKILFFGRGLNMLDSTGRGVHNTYIEAIYYLGCVGTFIVAYGIKLAVGNVSFKKIMWIPVLTLLVRMLAIGIVTHDNLWFYLSIFILISQYVEKDA